MCDHFKSAAAIAEEVVSSRIGNNPTPALPSIDSLASCANRLRKKMRPPEPQDLEFQLDEDYIPRGFFWFDVKVENKRHLIFATDQQLALLSSAKSWYIDATFNVVKAPFTQLFSIHCFLKKNGELKQVPMVFVMMSSKRKQDYKKVLKKVKNMLPRPPQVEKVVADFEVGMWRGMLGVFPNIKIQGCYFHWTQAIRRKIGELGLLKSFNHKGNVHTFCKKIMALPSSLKKTSPLPFMV